MSDARHWRDRVACAAVQRTGGRIDATSVTAARRIVDRGLVAAMGGFDRPILHGLCTYGFTGRALLHTLCDGDPSRFKSMDGRFSKPVMPGDELTISMWVDGNKALFQTRNQDGDVVLDQGECTFA